MSSIQKTILAAAALAAALIGQPQASMALATQQSGISTASTTYVSSTPVISDSPAVGALQHPSDVATWISGTTLTYEWTSNGTTVATTLDYTPTPADLGATLVLKVTGTLVGYDTTTVSSNAATVLLGTTHDVGQCYIAFPVGRGVQPNIEIEAMCPTPPVAGVTRVYQWRIDGVQIATGPTYLVKPADLGKKVSLRVVSSAPGYNDFTWLTASITALAGEQVIKGTPKISGVLRVGQTVFADEGVWAPGETFTYVWKNILQEVSYQRSYQLTQTTDGLNLTVCAHLAGSLDSCWTSDVNVVQPGLITKAPKPKLNGDPVVGSFLWFEIGNWQPGVKLSFQWLKDGKAIRGANGGQYTVSKKDKGHRISVAVTGSQPQYISKTMASSALKIK